MLTRQEFLEKIMQSIQNKETRIFPVQVKTTVLRALPLELINGEWLTFRYLYKIYGKNDEPSIYCFEINESTTTEDISDIVAFLEDNIYECYKNHPTDARCGDGGGIFPMWEGEYSEWEYATRLLS